MLFLGHREVSILPERWLNACHLAPSVQPPPRLLELHEVDIVCEVPWVSRHALLLQGTGIKHRLSLGLAAENNHKVGSHDGLAILVELNNAILGELG